MYSSGMKLGMNKKQIEWKIKYWCGDKGKGTLEEWLDVLSLEQLKSIAKEMRLLELCGNLLKLPHSRSLKKGLFELRERKYGFRIYYTFLQNKEIIMLHAGNKKTQEKDIKVARERLIELNREVGERI